MSDDAKKKTPMTDSQKLVAAVAQNQTKIRELAAKLEHTEMDSGIDTAVLVSRLEKVEKQNWWLRTGLIAVSLVTVCVVIVSSGIGHKNDHDIANEIERYLVSERKSLFDAEENFVMMQQPSSQRKSLTVDLLHAREIRLWHNGKMDARLSGQSGTWPGLVLYKDGEMTTWLSPERLLMDGEEGGRMDISPSGGSRYTRP